MEKNNGRGIFVGVVGVATLVVAIIGATFAYFTASANGANNAATAGSANVAGTIGIEDEDLTGLKTNMIPVKETVMTTSYTQTGTGADAKCAGLSQAGGPTVYNLCSYYKFTVTNSASVAQTVYLGLTSGTNSFENLWYALYDDAGNLVTNNNATAANLALNSSGVAVTGSDLGMFKKVPAASDTNITSTNLEAQTGSKTYILVLYVHDTLGDQTSADSGKSFAGTINITSADGTNYITGKIATP